MHRSRLGAVRCDSVGRESRKESRLGSIGVALCRVSVHVWISDRCIDSSCEIVSHTSSRCSVRAHSQQSSLFIGQISAQSRASERQRHDHIGLLVEEWRRGSAQGHSQQRQSESSQHSHAHAAVPGLGFNRIDQLRRLRIGFCGCDDACSAPFCLDLGRRLCEVGVSWIASRVSENQSSPIKRMESFESAQVEAQFVEFTTTNCQSRGAQNRDLQ